MKCELRLGLGILLTTLACDDGQKADLGVGVGGHPGTGGKSDVATGGATSGAPTLAGGGGEWAAGSAGRQSQAGAGIAGTGFELGYCRASYDETRAHAVFKCPTEFCAALTSAVSTSDSSLPVFSGAEVRAGRCTAPEDAFDSVYFGTGVGSTGCYYRAGVLVGMATWEDSSVSLSNGCHVALGPVVYAEIPDSALKQYLKGCPGLTAYRTLRSVATGTAGAGNAAALGNCYQATDASCGPC